MPANATLSLGPIIRPVYPGLEIFPETSLVKPGANPKTWMVARFLAAPGFCPWHKQVCEFTLETTTKAGLDGVATAASCCGHPIAWELGPDVPHLPAAIRAAYLDRHQSRRKALPWTAEVNRHPGLEGWLTFIEALERAQRYNAAFKVTTEGQCEVGASVLFRGDSMAAEITLDVQQWLAHLGTVSNINRWTVLGKAAMSFAQWIVPLGEPRGDDRAVGAAA